MGGKFPIFLLRRGVKRCETVCEFWGSFLYPSQISSFLRVKGERGDAEQKVMPDNRSRDVLYPALIR